MSTEPPHSPEPAPQPEARPIEETLDELFTTLAALPEAQQVFYYVAICNILGYTPGRRMVAQFTGLSEHLTRAALSELASGNKLVHNNQRGRGGGYVLTQPATDLKEHQ